MQPPSLKQSQRSTTGSSGAESRYIRTWFWPWTSMTSEAAIVVQTMFVAGWALADFVSPGLIGTASTSALPSTVHGPVAYQGPPRFGSRKYPDAQVSRNESAAAPAALNASGLAEDGCDAEV